MLFSLADVFGVVAKTLPAESLSRPLCCSSDDPAETISSSLPVLAVPFLVHCADDDTAPTQWHNAAIAVTNERNPPSAKLVRKLYSL